MSINHLNIEQATSSIEVVSSSVIDKLYELALNPSLDSGSNIQGNLQVTHAYQDAIDYLLNKFPNLQINVTGGAYIRFADKEVEKICATNWGDGTGITAAQAAAVSSIGTVFSENSSICSFDEFKYFINVSELKGNEYGWYDIAFRGCSSLKSITLPYSIKIINYRCFADDTNLKIKFDNMQNIISLNGDSIFLNTKLSGIIDMPNLTGILRAAVFGNTLIDGVANLGNITTLWGSPYDFTSGVFNGCSLLKYIVLPNTVTYIKSRFANNCNSLQYIKCLSDTPPTIDSEAFINTNNCSIYVPDSSLNSYKEATNWSTYSTRIKALSTFATDFPNG